MDATTFMTSENGNLQEMWSAKLKRTNAPIEVIDLSQSSDGEEENGLNGIANGAQSMKAENQQSKRKKNLDVLTKVARKGKVKTAIEVIDLSQGFEARKLDGIFKVLQCKKMEQPRKRQKRPRVVNFFQIDSVHCKETTSEGPSLREANGNLQQPCPQPIAKKEVGNLKTKLKKSSAKVADEDNQKRKKETTTLAEGGNIEVGINKPSTTLGEDVSLQKIKAKTKSEVPNGGLDIVVERSDDIKKTKKRKKVEEFLRDPAKGMIDSCSPSAGKEKIVEKEIVIPDGVQMEQVANVELPTDAVGPALQVLEFCSAFRQPLRLRKNQAERVLQEMVRGGTLRRGGQSDLIQLHVRLLSMILDEEEEDWKQKLLVTDPQEALFKDSASSHDKEDMTSRIRDGDSSSMKSRSVSCLSWPLLTEDGSMIKKALQDGVGSYGELSVATRVQLLASLCDDSLSTTIMRDHLEKVISSHNHDLKEDREKLLALKKRIREADELKVEPDANEVSASGKSVPLMTSRAQAQLLAKVKRQAADLAASEATLSESTARLHGPRCDAVRTEPAAVHSSGGRFWRLHGADERSVVLFQDLSNLDSEGPKEAWSIFSKDQSEVVGQCIEAICLRDKTSRRSQTRRSKKKDPPNALPGNPSDESCANPVVHVVVSSSSESI